LLNFTDILVSQGHFLKVKSFDFSKIFLRLWNPKIHYCIHKLVQQLSTLSQMNPVQTLVFRLLKANLVLSSQPYHMLGSFLQLRYVLLVSCLTAEYPYISLAFLSLALTWTANISGRTSNVYIHYFYSLVWLRGGTPLLVDI